MGMCVRKSTLNHAICANRDHVPTPESYNVPRSSFTRIQDMNHAILQQQAALNPMFKPKICNDDPRVGDKV
ncbi:hypothetical protein CVT25_002769 [Psilocybe cyanescens]|uniref:Uncharacterized protein n=1 Tax=Psilocybe cyanescens TaxID=93625 RepID=A0A409XC95_PSICY|nr:hypothetical protein CVT25_002769 [Psilocybe cyanescens]